MLPATLNPSPSVAAATNDASPGPGADAGDEAGAEADADPGPDADPADGDCLSPFELIAGDPELSIHHSIIEVLFPSECS